MLGRVRESVRLVLALAFASMLPIALAAQDSAKPAAASTESETLSKWDVFAGYSYIGPNGTIQTPVGGPVSPLPVNYTAITPGGILSIARYFNKYAGIELVGDSHQEDESGVNGVWVSSKDDMSGGSAGMILRLPTADVTPFIHGLAGADYVGGPHFQTDAWGPALTAGGGLDYSTPLFNRRLAIRLFQADYQYVHVDFGPITNGGRANINAARLSAGLVFRIGSIVPPPPVTLACSASPGVVFPGDPLTVTATAGNLDPKLKSAYTWSGTGVTGNGATATVATGSLAAGTYTVRGEVKQGTPGKLGLKPGETADCSASITVKAFEPPTLTCSASPSSITAGDTSAITAAGMSPQNRPLTYTYSVASGTIAGTGASATFNSTGAATGPIIIACDVADDKGGRASSSTTITVAAPYVPPPVESPEVKQLETRLALHSVFFPTNLPRTDNPTGGLVASQEKTLTSLGADFKKYLEFKPDAHLTLIGHADMRGSADYNKALSERRVARTKAFLAEQGVPDASIETQGLGSEKNLTAAQVKELVEQNTELSAAERDKVLHDLGVIVWAQNRRVDIVLSTTGQESVRQFPFNAADSLTLIGTKTPAPVKKGAAEKGHTGPAKQK